MDEDKLNKWFWDKFNSCYAVRHDDYPNSIFCFYDKSFVRKFKLCEIINQEVTLPSKVSGKCIFEQNLTTCKFNCDYDEIWSVFYDNYSDDYKDVQSLIKGWLEEKEKLNTLTPGWHFIHASYKLQETDKLSVLTPRTFGVAIKYVLEETDKLSILTPEIDYSKIHLGLEDTNKLSVLIK